ncbi:MAG: glycosyl transferase [Candidatus Melainabacteria bacterium]|nr:MAG: glycosyl transferase [Candidatus Melainabacteria bacterium]
MRIAQVAPLLESVPPKYYGGTERVVHWLTEELFRSGHEVTLFASGDSFTSAKLVPMCQKALRFDNNCTDKVVPHMLMLEKISQMAADFDLVHFHLEYLHLSSARKLPIPSLTTMHGRLDMSYLLPIFDEFSKAPLVSISNAQRRPVPWLNWQDTIYHGLPLNTYSFVEEPQNYALFLGRICPEKGVDRAIEIARTAGVPLKIAAKVDPVDREYYRDVIKPLLQGSDVEYIGEVGESVKNELIGGACALLHPIDFPEPFGIVLIEALACGTPIVAYRRGSIAEVIEEGVTGFICDDIQAAVVALHKVQKLNRRACRDAFEKRFTSRHMVRDYIQTYERLLLREHFADTQRLARISPATTSIATESFTIGSNGF